MKRVRLKRGLDPFLEAIAQSAKPIRRPVPRQQPGPANHTADNKVGFLTWRDHGGRDRLTGPNGKRVILVTYEDGSTQVL